MGNEENNNEVNTDQQGENIETGQNGDNGNQTVRLVQSLQVKKLLLRQK